MAGVELRGLGKRYPNGVEAVASVDLAVADGEFFAVVGPSGSGKSTLLRLIAGLETPGTGTVAIGGRDVTALPPRDRDLAMVFQEAALYPHLSVFDNLAFGLRARGQARELGKNELRARVETAAEGLGLLGVLDRRPETLSGGQRQRVAFGRAIVRRPSVFLFDEPLSGLDAPLRASIRADLIDLHRALGATMFYVTHDQGEALAVADRLGVMDRGRLVQVGTPAEVYHAPASRTVAEFVGSPPMNVVPCALRDGPPPTLVPDGLEPSPPFAAAWASRLLARGVGAVDLGVRPEHVHLVRSADRDTRLAWLSAPLDVVRSEYLGHETVVTLALGRHALAARHQGPDAPRPGDRITIGLDLDRASWFDPATGSAVRP